MTHDQENQCTVEEEVASLLKTLIDQVPILKDTCKMPKDTQRCHKTLSILEFHKHTQTSQIQDSLLEHPTLKNALKPYDNVWEKTCGYNADTLNHMKPWLPGPMVVDLLQNFVVSFIDFLIHR